jgi:hypothetical protein
MSMRFEWAMSCLLRPDTPAAFLAELRFHLGLADTEPITRQLPYDRPAELRGIGVHIEDDVLVTSAGARVMSDGLPRTASEVETWLAAQGAAGPRLPGWEDDGTAAVSPAATEVAAR